MTEADSSLTDLADAVLVAALIAVDPFGLGGVVIRGAPTPARDALLDLMGDLLPLNAPIRRCPITITDDRLLGGLDLAASLAAGRPVAQRGLLAEADGGLVVLPMAERLTGQAGARFASVLDDGVVTMERDGLSVRSAARIGVIALDEGVEPDERPPAALMERLAFRLNIDEVALTDLIVDAFDREGLSAARDRYPSVQIGSEACLTGLCEAASAFGIGSARACVLALRAARAHAALVGRGEANLDDMTIAARLVLAPRATRFPDDSAQIDEETSQPPDDLEPHQNPADADALPPEPSPESQQPPAAQEPTPTDLLIEATKAALPANLIAQIVAGTANRRSVRSNASGGGDTMPSARRGRPVSARQGDLRYGERLNIIETLRAAAPWQVLRRGAGAPQTRLQVRKSDFRVRRFVERREETTIFVVDASGSAAFQRLAEAKGAVELLLAQAYVTRARVALVAFRKTAADLILPPTRSLSRARRELADLAGGGGTPLALGIDTALQVALSERAKGRTPRLLILTDGRANIARDGISGRARAQADALSAAKQVHMAGIAAIHIDTAPRPSPDAAVLAAAMGALYAPLPYLDARAVIGVASANRGQASLAA